MSRRRPLFLGLLLALAVLAADQLSKLWLLGLLEEQGPRPLLPFFNLVLVWNRGVSFGLFGGAGLGPWPLLALSAGIVAGLSVWLWRVDNHWLAAGIGAVIGGAVGNMIDRLAYGAVADFFDFHIAGYHWPAFNVADAAIVGGVIALVLEAPMSRRRAGRQGGSGP